jgi:hypothetical protein
LTWSLPIIRYPVSLERKWLLKWKAKAGNPDSSLQRFGEAPLGSDHTDLVITKGMPAVEFLREVGKLLPK